MKLFNIIILALYLHAPITHAQDDNNCPVALFTTGFATCAAVCLTLDTYMRSKRGDFKDNAPLKRMLITTTSSVIAASIAAATTAFYSCNK